MLALDSKILGAKNNSNDNDNKNERLGNCELQLATCNMQYNKTFEKLSTSIDRQAFAKIQCLAG